MSTKNNKKLSADRLIVVSCHIVVFTFLCGFLVVVAPKTNSRLLCFARNPRSSQCDNDFPSFVWLLVAFDTSHRSFCHSSSLTILEVFVFFFLLSWKVKKQQNSRDEATFGRLGRLFFSVIAFLEITAVNRHGTRTHMQPTERTIGLLRHHQKRELTFTTTFDSRNCACAFCRCRRRSALSFSLFLHVFALSCLALHMCRDSAHWIIVVENKFYSRSHCSSVVDVTFLSLSFFGTYFSLSSFALRIFKRKERVKSMRRALFSRVDKLRHRFSTGRTRKHLIVHIGDCT